MTNYYFGLKGIYFYSILHTIIRLGQLDRRPEKILDFGCGYGKLKELLGTRVINYDLNPKFSSIPNWKKAEFGVLVANEVFYQFTPRQLRNFVNGLFNLNPQCELIVGIARQNTLSNILKYLAGHSDAHAGTNVSPKKEIAILMEQMSVVDHASVFFLCDVYRLRFRRSKP